MWERPGLSKRDHSLITVATLAALYRTEQHGFTCAGRWRTGLTQDELVEAVTHLAFYAGWPTSMTAITQLKNIIEEPGRWTG